MPELPEVQTVCDELENFLPGRHFSQIITLRDKIRVPIPDLTVIEGLKIKQVHRRAKYIVINLTDNPPLIIHLGMSGKITIGEPQERKKHDHVVFELDDGSEMVFNDARRFGLVTLGGDDLFAHLGVEPLSEEFDTDYLYAKLSNKSAPVKNIIMNQEVVVGVGNIYASEALFRSGILPSRAANKIKHKECELLVQNIKAVLREAIASGGSTLRDYVRSSGDLGYFQHSHKVYGREGEACVSCSSEIKMMRQAGRSSFYCSICQS
ncbi:MAG: DNA-formamidopyrimidine glycosylase [Alphaproteobacteria bacterium CG11_big_fil_rev_8_21_14_0_20_44_7]|nr:MAG: DNA-formamidopyrimidine glycosylase [Alphaproteobacteria bacterium CG11_big_fil_rev_8_21_14_0_20_44_7]